MLSFRYCLAAVLCLVVLPAARAEQVFFRYVVADAAGNMKQVAAGPNGALGERRAGVMLAAEPYAYVVRPNVMVTFRHPYANRNVTVPLRLPDSTPRLEHRPDRIVYNYGSYTVAVLFFQDGSVGTLYNSGYLRPLTFQ